MESFAFQQKEKEWAFAGLTIGTCPVWGSGYTTHMKTNFLYPFIFCICIYVCICICIVYNKLHSFYKSMKQGVSWRCPSVFHFKLSHLIPPFPLYSFCPPFFPPPINNILWRRMEKEEKETLAVFAFCYLQPVLTNNLLKVKRCSSISFSIRPQIVAPPMVNTQKETLQQSKQSKRLLNFPSIRRADRWH